MTLKGAATYCRAGINDNGCKFVAVAVVDFAVYQATCSSRELSVLGIHTELQFDCIQNSNALTIMKYLPLLLQNSGPALVKNFFLHSAVRYAF